MVGGTTALVADGPLPGWARRDGRQLPATTRRGSRRRRPGDGWQAEINTTINEDLERENSKYPKMPPDAVSRRTLLTDKGIIQDFTDFTKRFHSTAAESRVSHGASYS
jgi:hypothetical protein